MTTIDPRLDDDDWAHIFCPEEDADGYRYGIDPYTARPGDVRTREIVKSNYRRSDVAEVLAISNGENDGPDWVGVFRMRDGRFLTVRAGCDYTGWGCQEIGSSDVADNIEDALTFGLTEEERNRLFPVGPAGVSR